MKSSLGTGNAGEIALSRSVQLKFWLIRTHCVELQIRIANVDNRSNTANQTDLGAFNTMSETNSRCHICCRQRKLHSPSFAHATSSICKLKMQQFYYCLLKSTRYYIFCLCIYICYKDMYCLPF